jgi:hypothetical protein
MRNGIPPSLDRREFLLRTTAAGTALALAGAAALYLLTIPGLPEPGLSSTALDPASPEATLAERDRAAAYKAVRHHMHHRPWGSDIKAVYCRDSAHRVFYGGMEFEGRIDLEPVNGDLIPMDYTATVKGDRDAGWTVESVRLKSLDGYSDGVSEEGDSDGSALIGDAGPNALMPEASTQ